MIPERPPLEFRVTKYDPSNRDARGIYLNDDWTSYADVELGRVSVDDYERVEGSYISAAMMLMNDSGVAQLSLRDIKGNSHAPADIAIDDLPAVMKPILRDQYWARLHSREAFLHIGWDYYMYLGLSSVREDTLQKIEAQGLFVEPFRSPYFPEDDER